MREAGLKVKGKWFALLLGGVIVLILLGWFWDRPSHVRNATGTSTASHTITGPSAGDRHSTADVAHLQVSAITGQVKVASGALSSAQVCITPADIRGRASLLGFVDQCVATASDGSYRLDGLIPGRYVVSAGAEGFLVVQHRETPEQPWITLEPNRVRDNLDFILRVRGVPLRGIVNDVTGGTIHGAVVSDGQGGRTFTNDAGEFTLWALPQTTVVVTAFANGYTSDSIDAHPPQPPLGFWLSPESVLHGRVTRSDTGTPLPGLAVHLRNEEYSDTETSADGSFELRGLSPGRYKPFIRDNGWCGSMEPSVTLGLGENSGPIAIVAHPCRLLTARVQVRPSGQPCVSAHIELLDRAGDIVRRASTDSAGIASLSGVEIGVYRVKIRCPGYIQRAPEPWVLDESTGGDVTWEVEGGRKLQGVVHDHHGKPVPRATVEVLGAWGNVTTDADDVGQFVVAAVQPGPITVTPYHARYALGIKHELDVSESRDPPPITLEFPASSAGVVTGHIRARIGALPPGLTVIARASDTFGAKSVRVEEDGRFTIAGLEPKPHEIIVQRYGGIREHGASGEVSEPVNVDLSERGTAEANFVIDIQGLSQLAGQVDSADGSPEPDALITVTNPMNRERKRVLTDEAGRFSVEVLGDTTYTVDVTARDGSTLQQKGAKPGLPLSLRLIATRRVCGVAEADLLPITGSITIDTDVGGSETFASGGERWCLSRVQVGKRTFNAHSERFGSARRTMWVPATGEISDVTLIFAGRASLRGHVIDGIGQPRPRFRIWVLDAAGRLVGGNLYTDSAGEFVLDGVPAGEVTVIPLPAGPFPSRDELLTRGTTVQIAAGGPTELVLSVP